MESIHHPDEPGTAMANENASTSANTPLSVYREPQRHNVSGILDRQAG
jgi:hypothetical protein